MKLKLSLIFFSVLLITNCHGQKLTLTDLMMVCGKQNWESVNTYLIEKGWDYYDSEKGDSYQHSTITWSYDKEYYSDKANGWFYLYTYDGVPNKISYSVFNKSSYSFILKAVDGAGFKLANSQIEDNLLVSTYTNKSYILKIRSQKRESDDYNKSSATAYNFSLIRKAGIYDFDNGKKIKYHANGQINAEYTLTNGKINGPLKVYYEDGTLQKSGNYVNGKEHGKFFEYDDNGLLSSEYNMSNGLLHGVYTAYRNGLKSQEVSFINDMKSGKYAEYHYDENDQLYLKIIGNYKNDKKNGKWVSIEIHNGVEEIVEYKNYLDDKKNGAFKEFVGSDTIETKHYENDILNGPFQRDVKKNFYLSGRTGEVYSWQLDCEGMYMNGQENGQWTFYNLGNKSEYGVFLNGKRVGKWVSYVVLGDRSGEILSEIEYTNGEKNGLSKTYFELTMEHDSTSEFMSYKIKNVPINEVVQYKNDKKQGEYILKDSLGNIRITGYYDNDLKEETWKYYHLNNSYHHIEYRNDERLKALYFDEANKIFLKEIYANDQLTECEYYHESQLIQKHFVTPTSVGFNVVVYYYTGSGQDTISTVTYIVKGEGEYNYQLFSENGIKEGAYKLLVKNEKIIEGTYCQDQKCGNWTYKYPQLGLYSAKLYKENLVKLEMYYEAQNGQPYSGKIELVDSGVKEIFKVKKGLRNGTTLIYSLDGVKIREENYKKGIKIK